MKHLSKLFLLTAILLVGGCSELDFNVEAGTTNDDEKDRTEELKEAFQDDIRIHNGVEMIISGRKPAGQLYMFSETRINFLTNQVCQLSGHKTGDAKTIAEDCTSISDLDSVAQENIRSLKAVFADELAY